MADVFISYARSDEPSARQIAESLAALGYVVWRDDAVLPHHTYSAVIETELRAAKVAIVLWSKDARASQWVRAEAEAAREDGKLVQVVVDETTPPLPFNQIQFANLAAWAGDANSSEWRKVIASVSALTRNAAPVASSRASSTLPVLAVLPFDNVSNDPELVYFSDGVSEEILQTVAQTTQLRTIGRSSSFQFRGADKAVRKVAAQLNATHVLDGSVRRSGPRVRITAQLIDCASQTTLWSKRFDRELSDVFALQDEVASAVADALNVTFAPSAQVGPIDPIAYDLYLRARATTSHYLGAGNRPLLETAVARAPGYAKAWASLAMTLAIEAQGLTFDAMPSADEEPFEVLHGRAIDAANKAIALARDSGIPHVALSILEPICGRFAERDALIGKALALSPDEPVVLFWACRWSRAVGRNRDALDFAARAHAVDPLWPQGMNEYATMLAQLDRPAESAQLFDSARARWPESDYLALNPISCAFALGDWDRVERLIQNVREIGPHTPDVSHEIESMSALRAWSAADSARLLDRLRRQLDATGTISLQLGWACAVGMTDEVYELIDRASFEHLFRPGGRLVAGDYGLHRLFVLGEAMRRDPRFVRWCARLGLCDYWAKTDRWPDCVDEVAPYYDFKREARRLVEQR